MVSKPRQYPCSLGRVFEVPGVAAQETPLVPIAPAASPTQGPTSSGNLEKFQVKKCEK